METEFLDFILEQKVEGWEPSYDRCGGLISWYHPKYENITIMATPDWDSVGMTPFEIIIDAEEGTSMGSTKNENYIFRLRELITMILAIKK
jgi:hypothetical protein